MEIYAVAISANIRRYGYIENISKPLGVSARTKEEAVGLALNALREYCPQSDGWYGHQVAELLLDSRWLKEEMEK